MKSKNVLVVWALMLFAVSIVIINGALSFAFGYAYLGQAFGLSGWLAPVIGGMYAVLVADAAFLVWFWAYRRTAETVVQRSLSLVVGILALALSIAMSVNQLAVNSYGLVDLSAYHVGVGLVALSAMIVVTAVHIASLAVFSLADADERVKSRGIDIRARLVDESLAGVEQSMDHIRGDIVSQLQMAVRRDVLLQLGQMPGVGGGERFPVAISENGSGEEAAEIR